MAHKRKIGELWTTRDPSPPRDVKSLRLSPAPDCVHARGLTGPVSPGDLARPTETTASEPGPKRDSTSPDIPAVSDVAPGFPVVSECSRTTPGFPVVSVSECDGVTVALEDQDLWRTFYSCGTEMIINRPGRRMFPSVVVSARGLNPSAEYSMLMEVVPADDKRYKYVNNRWTVVGKADPSIQNPAYVHPDSPSKGRFWMQTKISFAKIKITNNRESEEGNILIQSMHKYMAQLTIVRKPSPDHPSESRLVFPMPLTAFIAVTAYQSENITQMKIRNNPFAKAFRDGDIRCSLMNGGDRLGRQHNADKLHERTAMTRPGFDPNAPFRTFLSPLASAPPAGLPPLAPFPGLGWTLPGFGVPCPPSAMFGSSFLPAPPAGLLPRHSRVPYLLPPGFMTSPVAHPMTSPHKLNLLSDRASLQTQFVRHMTSSASRDPSAERSSPGEITCASGVSPEREAK